MYSVKVLADSISPKGIRLFTAELIYPRIVHSEFMTHRVKSRNAGSNRAIPAAKLLAAVTEEPFVPIYWGKNQKGMNPGDEFNPETVKQLETIWLEARDDATKHASRLLEFGVHKGIPNRLLEAWQWITVIVSATEWNNFFNLRIDKDAEPHMRELAYRIWQEYSASTPKPMIIGDWHLPLIYDDDRQEVYQTLRQQHNYSYGAYNKMLAKISTGRCARVSYLTHNGVRSIEEDIRLHNQLLQNGHWSPFEHSAQCMEDMSWRGNFRGWRQYRKFFKTENRTDFDPEKVTQLYA
jgi:thymidylate synthase ThyX